MRTLRCSARLFLLFAVMLSSAASGAAQDLAAKVDAYMAAQMKVNRFSGSILLAREGKVLSKGYGMANVEHDVPNAPQTKFRVGSITKQFTSMSILLLEEREKLRTTDTICGYFPDCPAAWAEVTIHHLLTHTSGIPSYTNSPDYAKGMAQLVTPEQMVARFRDKPLEFAPGTTFKYDNSGYFLLGMIIEKVSGQKYEDFLRVNIFEPLGMKNTGYDHFETILKNRATGYARSGNGLVNAAYLDMSQPYAAGSLYSTVEDLYIWDQALAADKLLTPKSYEKLYTPFKSGYAYGWVVAPRFNRKSISHGGGINGFSTNIARYPDEKVCVIVLSNVESAAAGRVGRDLEAILLGEAYETPKERVAIQVDPKTYDAYVGKYERRPEFVLTVTHEGDKLMTQATGQPKFEIFPESETKFFLKVVDAQVTFVRDSAGKVTHLILHQGGANQQAKKVE